MNRGHKRLLAPYTNGLSETLIRFLRCHNIKLAHKTTFFQVSAKYNISLNTKTGWYTNSHTIRFGVLLLAKPYLVVQGKHRFNRALFNHLPIYTSGGIHPGPFGPSLTMKLIMPRIVAPHAWRSRATSHELFSLLFLHHVKARLTIQRLPFVQHVLWLKLWFSDSVGTCLMHGEECVDEEPIKQTGTLFSPVWFCSWRVDIPSLKRFRIINVFPLKDSYANEAP